MSLPFISVIEFERYVFEVRIDALRKLAPGFTKLSEIVVVNPECLYTFPADVL